MPSLRSLQRRRDGVELWAIIPQRLDTDRSYVVRSPASVVAEEHFGDLGAAEEAFRRRLKDGSPHRRDS
ncbi:hypothetical protein [Plastoroseomonas hellenica]|uniref:hypothetical protein n=1 Tax=Plastoroseomonas hellenica TaxID=2687306 RepID=UPI001BA5A14B|nr:hypothetical protein [Plastoroseomonas hellenica]MBR0646139.1 hypothetical protein [Plastoroseomonas hellenica]